MERFQQLNRMTKPAVIAQYRRLGHVWSLHPLEKWTKEEIINGVLDIELRRPDPDPLPPIQDVTRSSQWGALDATKPYGFRVLRADGERDWVYSYGYRDVTGHPSDTAARSSLEVAIDQAHATRVGHSYFGPLRVYVWQRRENDHYRLPVPDTADHFDFPEHPKLAEWLEQHRAKETQG
jgi:hypothetical protein